MIKTQAASYSYSAFIIHHSSSSRPSILIFLPRRSTPIRLPTFGRALFRRALLPRSLRPLPFPDDLSRVAGDGELVFDLLQEPERAPPLLAPLHAEETPATARPLAFEPEAERARAPGGGGVVSLRLERPRVPAVNFARPVSAFGQHALEGQVRERVVGHLDGEALGRGVERRPLRHGPALERAADLQAEVPMQVARVVLLHDEFGPALHGLILPQRSGRRGGQVSTGSGSDRVV